MKRMRGFTLLEVLLAFTLLAVALGILLSIVGSGLGQVRNAGEASEATLHAQSFLAALGVLEPIEPGTRQGEFEDSPYRWSLDVSEFEDPVADGPASPSGDPPESVGRQFDSAPILYRVQLDVAWGEGEDARSLRFVTLRARRPAVDALELP